MKKLLSAICLCLILTGAGCAGSGPSSEVNEEWRELAVEFAIHHGPALRAGEDVSESEALYLEATDLYEVGHYTEAIDKAQESIDLMISKGY